VNHALVTIIAKVSAENFERARTLVEALGNPAAAPAREAFEAVAAEPGELAIHFSSLTVFPATGGGGHLLFEFSGDGPAPELIQALARHLGPLVKPAFELAADWSGEALAAYWTSHVVNVGHGYFSNPGVVFAGTPDMSVKRIRDEQRLRERLKSIVEEDRTAFTSALDTLDRVRSTLRADASFAWALEPKDTATLHAERSGVGPYLKIGLSAARTYLWPLLIPPLLVLVLAVWMDPTRAGAMRAVMNAFVAAVATVALALVALGVAYAKFRRAEDADSPDNRPPDPRMVALIQARENHGAQNHLSGISVMKPGRLRRLALKLIFAVITQLATHLFRPGWLGTLGTIHFARWVMVPGTGDLLFLSNYGGSWESYLEDFITKAHAGLTGVWSNTIGFPRTLNLIQGGATDGDHFKRWARRQQVPTGCWYTAYPSLTTTNIRTNAAIRQGLGTICTEEEARRWLLLFGARPRPAGAMEVNEIQSLAFGGLGFLKYAMCAGFSLADDRARARDWLREVEPHVAYGDGRKHIHRAVILGLGPDALRKLRLDADALNTFPSAYLDGMASASRSRILGDDGGNAAKEWEWGGPGRNVDGVLLLYADIPAHLEELRNKMAACLERYGHRVVMEVPFADLPEKNATKEQKWQAKLEPFGFVDGVSQPAIRGTYKALRGADPIHIVEPGEFILGYPDNRGNLPTGPTLQAIHDPSNVLPISAAPQHGFARPIVNDDRDLGRNGSFLAVRQIEQNVDGFWEYCAHAAAELRLQFPRWVDVNQEFVGAKMVGRWMDGSSLVRFPYHAGSEDVDARQLTRTAAGTGEPAMPVPLAPGITPQKTPSPEAPVPAHAALKVRRTRDAVREVAITPDNDFLFGAEDPQGLRCPFGSHIRRANPRESADPGSEEQLAITNRHRLLRVGRRYEPEKDRNPGQFFMCLNADLERQFEFVQQTWLQSPTFHGLIDERDPIVGSRHGADAGHTDDGYSIPTRETPVRLRAMPDFVRTLGGGYFFVPGRAVLRYLAIP
jgi:deferrochelatase/peroxidase EfeB